MEVNGPRWQVMEHFKSFMEDYNTATMPHEKCVPLAVATSVEVPCRSTMSSPLQQVL